MNILLDLRRRFAAALESMVPNPQEVALQVRPAQDAKFGDYQANCAMPLAKQLGGKPRDIAQKIIDRLPERDSFSSIEIAGPGFINLRLSDHFLKSRLAALFLDVDFGLEPMNPPPVMVIDFSSPNVAKPMHVGHLRSTILGDALARIHRALGWKVIADNHIGDWGTQFGMLIHGWRHLKDLENAEKDPLGELNRLYPLVNKLSEADPSIAEAARAETAKLHEGDPENLRLWNAFLPWCLADLAKIYDRLDIRFDHQFGESYYQPMLGDVVADLRAKNLAAESDGAICVFFPDPEGKTDDEGKPIPLLPPTIIQKKDGAFTYATSDLACIRYRVEKFHPSVIVYVVDDRQSLHFQQLFQTARWWGYENARLEHVAFGKIMGKDGRPYKTREGGVVNLSELLDEAVARARRIVDEESSHLPENERAIIAEAVGVGAVKYADLSQNRLSDYVFDWDKMISMTGNTATYLQYAFARNRSILRKGGIDPAALTVDPATLVVEHSAERALALKILQYPEALTQAAADFRPNLLTNYLFELANAYSTFYQECPVLKAETALKSSRALICELTANTLRAGLGLLGIRTPERM